MSEKQRLVAGKVDDFPKGKFHVRDLGGRSIGIYTNGEEFFAVQNVCPHALAPICRGRVGGTFLPSEKGQWLYALGGMVLQCPNHRWEFDIRTGESIMGADRRRLLTFPVELDGDDVVVTMRARPNSADAGE
jgi:nitrite reductase (NADH) small subunit